MTIFMLRAILGSIAIVMIALLSFGLFLHWVWFNFTQMIKYFYDTIRGIT